MSQDLYATLGIEKGATEAEIKKAYRKLAMKHHPDKKTGDEKKFKEITFAYEVLSDPQKRKQYDTYGSAGFQGGGGHGGAGQGFGGFDFSNFGQASGVEFNFDDLGDLFENFFGQGGRSKRRGSPQGGTQGRDVEAQVNVSFEEMVKGTEKNVSYEVYQKCENCGGKGYQKPEDVETCSNCHGTGQVEEIAQTFFGRMQQVRACPTCGGNGKKIKNKCKNCDGEGRIMKNVSLNIQIPAGIEDRTVLRLSGKGEAGSLGATDGDLYVRVNVSASNNYERRRNDLYSKLSIDVLQAILGDVVEVETPYGKKKIKVPGGSNNGQKIKLPGDGLTKPGGYEKGDLYVELEVEMPSKLSKKEFETYSKLAKDKGLDVDPQVKTGWL